MPRNVPADLAQLRWEHLCRGPAILSLAQSPTPGSTVFARQLLSQKLLYMLSCMQQQKRLVTTAWPRDELWVRVGVDGVRMWKSNVVSISLGPCSVLRDLPMHSMYRFGLAAVQRSQETVSALRFLMEDSGIAADMSTLDGSLVDTVDADGISRRVRVRLFVCGDHMALYKLTGARGPSSEADGMECCPYCRLWPSLVRDLSCQPPCPMTEARPAALVPMPPIQCPPDAMHGAVNVLHNSLLPRLSQLLAQESGWNASNVRSWLNGFLAVDVDYVREDYTMKKVDTLARSIDSAKAFLIERKWSGGMTDTLRSILRDRCTVDGAVGRVGDTFARCFLALSIQMDIVYLVAPLAPARALFRAETDVLRACMVALECKGTPWVHVWLGHMHQFLDHWGTLYYWLGHGVEGRHRRLKMEVRASTCGQWNRAGTVVGFAHCLRRDNVWWALLAAYAQPRLLGGRVDRRQASVYAAYRAGLQLLVDARADDPAVCTTAPTAPFLTALHSDHVT
jgi:hypothetical protein